MNAFVTDHPLVSQPFRLSKRVRRWLLFSVVGYPVYLLLLGPFYALDGHGCFAFASERVRETFYLPALPLYAAFGPYNFYDRYLSIWWQDPNAAETTW
ncbi:MAG TPA: hypothetical protein VHI52_05580 [Verrucomicrobiae bacterium]|nr:hypothetical protein [Verrucomicrobiae bacterium]